MRNYSGLPYPPDSGNLTATFESIEELDRDACAMIRETVNAKGKIRQGDQETLFEFDGERLLYRSLATGNDVKSLLTGNMVWTWSETVAGQEYRTEIRGPLSYEVFSQLR